LAKVRKGGNRKSLDVCRAWEPVTQRNAPGVNTGLVLDLKEKRKC